MGIGFCVILDKQYKDQALDILNKYHNTQVIGEVKEDENNKIFITARNENIEL
jgi:phosphoribosylaminoimidazole (AIR) synthetase